MSLKINQVQTHHFDESMFGCDPLAYPSTAPRNQRPLQRMRLRNAASPYVSSVPLPDDMPQADDPLAAILATHTHTLQNDSPEEMFD